MEKIIELLMTNPEAAVELAKNYIDKYKPTVYALLKECMEIHKDFANNKEYPATVAKVRRNQFEAYVDAGFSDEQAMALIINDNLNLMEAMKKPASNKTSVKKK